MPGRTILTCDYASKMKIYFQSKDSNFNTTDRKSITIFPNTTKILSAATNFFVVVPQFLSSLSFLLSHR